MIVDFSRPYLLALPLTLIPILWLGRALQRRSQRDWRALGQSTQLDPVRGVVLILAVLCFMVALAGPRWGTFASTVSSSRRDMVLLLDVSRSMAAEDAIPNRLGAAVLSAETLVKSLGESEGGRVAVVEFAGRGVLKCPMTENLGAVLDTLRTLEIGADGSMGTDVGDGVLRALDVFDDETKADSRSIVVLSDGEDHGGTWPNLIDRVKASGVRIHSVVVGDPSRGTPIPIVKDGRVERLRRDGEIVRSQPDETILKTLRDASHGSLVRMGRTAVDLRSLLRDLPENPSPVLSWRMDRSTSQPRYSLFVVAGLGLLAMTFRLPTRRFAVLSLVFFINAGFLPEGDTIPSLSHSASLAYSSGDFERALRIYEQIRNKAPEVAISHYNVASTLYQLQRYADATASYEKAREHAGEALQAKIDFAIANIAVMTQQPEEAIHLYKACIRRKATGRDLAIIKRDAALNLSYARTLLPPPPSPDPDGESQTRTPRPEPRSDEKSSSPPGSKKDDAEDASVPPSAPAAANPSRNPSKTESSTDRTPDEQLQSMLAAVQKGRVARQTDRPPASPESREVKDW